MLARVFAPVLVPVRVNVLAPVAKALVPTPLMPLKPRVVVPVKLRVSDEVAPEASSVAPPLPMLKRRLVLCAPLPVYFSVPLSITRLVLVTAAAPMLLLEPPLARAATFKMLPLPMPVARE